MRTCWPSPSGRSAGSGGSCSARRRTPGDVAAACEAVRPGTRRHTVSDAELTGHPGVPPEAAAAYLAVRAAVRAGEPLDAVAQLVPGLHAALRERDGGRAGAELERASARSSRSLAGSRSWRLTAPLRSIADGARAASRPAAVGTRAVAG